MSKDAPFVPISFNNKEDNQFYATLKSRVNQYFKDKGISNKANGTMYLKTVILGLAYISPYLILVLADVSTSVAFLLLTFMGMAYAGLGMSVMHDANHRAYSKSARVNNSLGYVLNFIGGNKHNWKIQHNVLHHNYTNVYGLDEDIENGDLFRLSPYSEVRWYHKYQHIYSWFLYAIGTLFWVTLKDFPQISRYNKQGLNGKKRKAWSKEFLIMVLTKLFYFGYIFVIPLIFTSYSIWAILLGFVCLHLVTGLLLGLTFQLAHVVENTAYLTGDKDKGIDKSWAAHQLYTTANFSKKSKFLNWYLGGLNFQVEHHLFPYVCHVHYNKLSDIVKQTAKEFSLPYNEYKTMGNAIYSHYKMLKTFGTEQMSVKA